MMPLGLLFAGEKAEIMFMRGSVNGTCLPDAFSKKGDVRAADIGLRPGKEIEVLNNQGRGALLVKIDESRLALARGIAMKIMVRRKDR